MRRGQSEGWAWKVTGLVMTGLLCLGTTGCNFFFVCSKASCTNNTTGTATSSGDYAYVTNSASGTEYLSAYELSTGSPIALAGSPFNLTFVPNAIAVVPGNALMFVSAPANGVIYAYTLASSGVPTIANNGAGVASESGTVGMDVTADGKYLFTVDYLLGSVILNEYSITNTSGGLKLQTTATSTLAATTTPVIKVAPSGNFAVVAEGAAGDAIFSLTNELLTSNVNQFTLPVPANNGDYAVTIDTGNNIYLARTNTVVTFSATATGAATQINNTTANSTTGSGDLSITLSHTGSYVYTGNVYASPPTLSAFTNSNGTLAAISGTPSAPSSVAAVAADNSGKYLVAAGSGSGGFVEYAIGSTGALTASSTTATLGSGGVTLMALTH